MNIDSAYALAFSLQKQRLSEKQAVYDAKIQTLYETNKEYKNTMDDLSKLGSQIIITTLEGNFDKIKELQDNAKKLNEYKSALILSAGIEPFTYDCKKCKDTGYVSGEICDCIKKSVSDILISDASKEIPINNSSFANFDLNYYPDTANDGTSPKKRMTAILKFAREYAISFSDKTTESIMFTGNTGLGKTHISLAIFNDLIKRGFNCLYSPAFNLFSKIESEHFNNNSTASFDESLNCDLLIIDDLGSEFSSPYVSAVIYNIINSRLLSNKPTIINTNLSAKEIESRYTPRVSSRIFGNYTVKKFIGNDIRQIKKLEK